MSEQSPLYQTMRNLRETGMAYQEVLKIGYECARAACYDEIAQSIRDGNAGPSAILTGYSEVEVMLRASEMLLEVSHELGLSPAAMKEKIGRTEENEV